MIISRIYKGQGFGNQLWCMVSAYALSLKKNYDCTFIDNTNSFLGHDIFDLSNNFFRNKATVKYKYYEKCFFDSNLNCKLFFFDKDLIKINKNTEIIGNFQSESYFFDKKKQIKNYFLINKKIKKLSSQFNNYNVLNIRGGEYKRHRELLLPYSYWMNLYDLLKKKSDLPIIIVSDDYHYSKKLFPNLDIISNDIKMCFAAIMGAKNIGVSNSSFSYFPIFFSENKKEIYGPYQWSRFNNNGNLWASPCNFYKYWKWIDINGRIVSDKKCNENIKFTSVYLKNNSKLSCFSLPKKELDILIHLKNIIKKLLGLFNWRYK